MGLGALRNVSLKRARETATQWCAVLREDRNPIKKELHKLLVIYAILLYLPYPLFFPFDIRLRVQLKFT